MSFCDIVPDSEGYLSRINFCRITHYESDRRLTTGVVNCRKRNAALETCCSQLSSTVLTTPKSTGYSLCDMTFIFCRAMLCIARPIRHAVSVCPSVTFVHSVETNKHIFKMFLSSGSRSILVFSYQTP